MAQRRMFSKDIVRSDMFLDLPLSAQCLYFQLGMDTDDRGYIPNGKSIIRLVGASLGDLELLIHKKFLLLRQDGTLLLQKHFKTNNYIRPDRFHETNYTEDLSLLFFDENGNYTENQTDKIVLGNQLGDTCPTEDKISKDKISKDKIRLIKLDRTRYKQSDLLQILIDNEYLSLNDIQDNGFDELIDKYVECFGYVDTKIKIQYFCDFLKTNSQEIESKYSYLKKSLDNSFRKTGARK